MARWLSTVPILLSLLSLSSQASAGSLRLGVALVVERGDTSAVSGWLRLEVPLDRVAAPRLAERPSAAPDEQAVEEDAAPEARPEADARSAPKPRERLPFRQDSAFARELVREALRLQGHATARDRLDGLAARSRVSAMLPELMLRAARSTDQSLRLTPSGAERYDFTQTGGADLLFEARATWNLDRLVFADDELRVEQLRRAREDAAEELALVVLKHLFSWRRAEARLAAGQLDAEGELDAELDALEAEAALDVLTDGLFGRRVAERSRKIAAEPPESSYSSKK